MNKIIATIPCLILCLGCTTKAGNPSPVNDGGGVTSFSLPHIPETLRDPHSRADYLIGHYWDHTSWADTAVTHQDSVLEQFFVDWLSVMPYASDTAVIGDAVRQIALQAQSSPDTAAITTLWSLASHYLYETSSPMLNESLYLSFVEAKVGISQDTTERERANDERRICLKNRPGEKAPDFLYLLPNGKKKLLSSYLKTTTGYTLLLFYDPDCEHCMETVQEFATTPFINDFLANGSLSILAIDTEGEDSPWRETLSHFPATWEVGWDRDMNILISDLYSLRAMPTLYLLDASGTVILKDPTLEKVAGELRK